MLKLVCLFYLVLYFTGTIFSQTKEDKSVTNFTKPKISTATAVTIPENVSPPVKDINLELELIKLELDLIKNYLVLLQSSTESLTVQLKSIDSGLVEKQNKILLLEDALQELGRENKNQDQKLNNLQDSLDRKISTEEKEKGKSNVFWEKKIDNLSLEIKKVYAQIEEVDKSIILVREQVMKIQEQQHRWENKAKEKDKKIFNSLWLGVAGLGISLLAILIQIF